MAFAPTNYASPSTIRNAYQQLMAPIYANPDSAEAKASAKQMADLTNQYGVSQNAFQDATGVSGDQVKQFLDRYNINPAKTFGADQSLVPGSAAYVAAHDTSPAAANVNYLQQGVDAAGPAPVYNAPGKFDFQADPGYAFRQQQGEQAINRASAARGGFFSGRVGKELADFNSGLASQEYGNAYNRYLQGNQDARATYDTQFGTYNNTVNRNLGILTQGANTARQDDATAYQRWLDSDNTNWNRLSQLSSSGQSASSATPPSSGQYITNAGNAQAGGYINQANAVNNGINNGLAYYAYLNNPWVKSTA